jgi:hypothetical protein
MGEALTCLGAAMFGDSWMSSFAAANATQIRQVEENYMFELI